MPFELSKAQEKAINAKNKNILVSAAAGAGKTFVLTQRVLDRIVNECWSIDSFLIVTFTRDAAAEMRTRIVKGIKERLDIARREGSSRLCSHLERQLILADRANISTIDAFCASVIRQNFHKTELDSGYRNINPPEAAELKTQAVNDILEELLPKSDIIGSFYNMFISKSSDRAVIDMIYSLYEFADNMPYPYKWLDECLEKYEAENLSETIWYSMYKKSIEDKFNRARESLDKVYGFLMDYGHNALPKNILKLEENLNTLYDLFINENYSGFGNVSLSVRSFVLKAEMKAMEKLSPYAFMHIDDIIFYGGETNSILKEIQANSMPSINEADEIYKGSRSNVYALAELTRAFMKRYNELKLEKQLADFNDIAHYCLGILRDENGNTTDIAREYQNKFNEIIIDEYQDSNYLQEEILTALSRSERGENNIFMVGDVKQAIYKFRKATPKLFMEKYNAYRKDGDKEELILLNNNYRSRAVVLDACNCIFRQIMDKNLGDVDYTDDAALKTGADYPDAGELNISLSTEVITLNAPGERGSTAEQEALLVAERIYDMLYTDPLYIYDKEEGYRPVRKSDIVILLRTRTKGDLFFKALNSIGIDCVFERSEPLFATEEIRLITDLLRLIDNPIQDIPLVSILHSPLYTLSYDDIGEIRLKNREDDLYTALRKKAEDEDIAASVLRKFFYDLDYYRDFAVNSSISELISEIYDRSNYFNYAGIMSRGHLRQSNLRLFREKAASFEGFSPMDIHSFIEYIDRDLGEDVGEGSREGGAAVLSDREDAVRIMTIHKSKGLEFPVVFVSQLDSRINIGDKTKDYIFDRELGIGLRHIDTERRIKHKTLPYEYITEKYDKEDHSELMRLLYVAFTRAKEKLIITGSLTSVKDSAQQAEKYKTQLLPLDFRTSKTNLFFWVRAAIMRSQFRGDAVFEIKDVNIEDIKAPEEYLAEESFDTLSRLNSLENSSTVRDDISKSLDYVYSYTEDTIVPSKISITEIKRKMNNTEDSLEYYYSSKIISEPAFMRDKNKMSNARIGTIYHSLMENINFNATESIGYIERHIESLVSKGIITEEERQAIDTKKISAFIASPLFKRIKNSEGIYREAPFVMSMAASRLKEYENSDRELVVHGIIDLYFEENGEYVIVDYKTDRVKKSAEELSEKYRIQLQLYSEALEKNTGKKVKECIIYSFDKGEEVNVKL